MDILNWCETNLIFEKDVKLFQKAIETNVEDIVKNPITDEKQAISRANELTLLVLQLLASASDIEGFQSKIKDGLIKSLAPKDQDKDEHLVKKAAEYAKTQLLTHFDNKFQQIKDMMADFNQNLSTRIHGVFQANTDMTLPQFADRWREYRTGHELRVILKNSQYIKFNNRSEKDRQADTRKSSKPVSRNTAYLQ